MMHQRLSAPDHHALQAVSLIQGQHINCSEAITTCKRYCPNQALLCDNQCSDCPNTTPQMPRMRCWSAPVGCEPEEPTDANAKLVAPPEKNVAGYSIACYNELCNGELSKDGALALDTCKLKCDNQPQCGGFVWWHNNECRTYQDCSYTSRGGGADHQIDNIVFSKTPKAKSCRNEDPKQDLQCVDPQYYFKLSNGNLSLNTGELGDIQWCKDYWNEHGGKWRFNFEETCEPLHPQPNATVTQPRAGGQIAALVTAHQDAATLVATNKPNIAPATNQAAIVPQYR